ncbi:MAG: transcriptional regulator GcvA [Alphaproteobacteria bacterium]|nr:transcriptional regulator GcvA [Alphaproteobacteria bacterium]TAD89103.1 MAG: transcriptional regulator GcvA [Alphaproteobacteria bacterium]
MARRLPPLNALRAFEAAARHGSFTRAADELNVTQAAISHQVKGLEERLGVLLFRRLNRALILTDAGERYLPALREAFDLIASATDSLTKGEQARRLTVSVMPSFANKWLMPRLVRFQDLQPEIEVTVHASEKLVDFGSDGVDVAIRYGTGGWPGLRAIPFLSEDVFPVCAPGLAERTGRPLFLPEDLRHHTLLHDDISQDWAMWLRLTGVTGVSATRGLVFNHSNMVVDAAVAGMGVALARSALVHDDLKAGRLIRPFRLAIPAQNSYWIVCPEDTADLPKLQVFQTWLTDEASRARREAETLAPSL